MLRGNAKFEAMMERECLYCKKKLVEATNSNKVQLTEKNDKGEDVPYAFRIEPSEEGAYWYNRLRLATPYVSKAFYLEHELSKKHPTEMGVSEYWYNIIMSLRNGMQEK